MNRINALMLSTATCLLVIASANAGSQKEPADLINLREEYSKKAKGEMDPINTRYLVLLGRMEKSYSRSVDKKNAKAVREEINRFEADSTHLFTFEADIRRKLSGKYENHHKTQNDYHFVEIEKSGSDSLKWTNRNGNEWILTPTDDVLIYHIGKDCSYYKLGDLDVSFKLRGRKVVGVEFRNGNYEREEKFSK